MTPFDRRAVPDVTSGGQPGGNMEGKEVRFGIANSALYATVTTAATYELGLLYQAFSKSLLAPATRLQVLVRMLLDIWGEVVSLNSRSGELVDLTLRDAVDRIVKVFGLAAFRVSRTTCGDKVWLFGLRTRDRRGGADRWRHPQNFFEVPDDDPFLRAWTLEMFTASEDTADASYLAM